MSRTITVTGQPPGLRQVISIGPHRLLADEAREAGSNDEGPDPYEYLLASLGACTNMTLRLYASHKGWPLKQIETTLSHSKSYAVDCENCERPAAMIDRIEMRIALSGELSDEQRKRLLEIANRCPLHRTLTSKIEILSSLEAGVTTPTHRDTGAYVAWATSQQPSRTPEETCSEQLNNSTCC